MRLVDFLTSIKLNVILLLNIYSITLKNLITMNATELEILRSQSDAMTLIGMLVMTCVFAIGGWLTNYE